MSTIVKIPLNDATNAQLLHYARTMLGLDVGPGSNNSTIRAKILQAQPDCEEIGVPEEVAGVPANAIAPAGQAPTAKKSAIPAGRAGQHHLYDPKVKLMIQPTTDPTRAKDVQVAVNGEVAIYQRGKPIEVAYRFYLALDAAIEKVARDGDEINPNTGLPVKEWVSQHSYPYQVLAMPSDEEIAAWEKRTASINAG